MRDFFDRLSANAHWFVFLILEITCGYLLFQFNRYQGSVWFTQANALMGTVLDWEAKAIQYIHLADNNKKLTHENLVLQYNMEVMRDELTRLKKDSSYTEKVLAEFLQDVHLIPAQIINNSIRDKDNYMTINRGEMDGVKPEMGVVSGTGVVGIVFQTTNHYSLIMPILHSKSSISCRLRDTDYFGYLKWRGGNPLQAYIDDIPRHAKFHVGDIVETSGYSNVFPAGIFVGRVAQIHNSDDGLSYQLEVQLSTDLSRLREVCVVAQENQIELDSLENQVY